MGVVWFWWCQAGKGWVWYSGKGEVFCGWRNVPGKGCLPVTVAGRGASTIRMVRIRNNYIFSNRKSVTQMNDGTSLKSVRQIR